MVLEIAIETKNKEDRKSPKGSFYFALIKGLNLIIKNANLKPYERHVFNIFFCVRGI